MIRKLLAALFLVLSLRGEDKGEGGTVNRVFDTSQACGSVFHYSRFVLLSVFLYTKMSIKDSH